MVLGDVEVGKTKTEEEDELLSLHITQFLDEWLFRVIHNNLAGHWDRQTALLKALSLFEESGAKPLTNEERIALVNLPQERLVAEIVQLLPPALRKNAEHFLLQVQLVLSTATRVRGAVEEGTSADMAASVEDQDSGATLQILREVVLSAVNRVAAVKAQTQVWVKCMATRTERLQRAAGERDAAEKELTALEREISLFGGEQNAKSKAVVSGLCAKNDKMLLTNIFANWVGYFKRYEHTKFIHDKYKALLESAQKKILDYKLNQKKSVNGVMNKKLMASNAEYQREVYGIWKEWKEREKEDRELADKIAATDNRLKNMHAGQKENAKKSMMRVCSGNDLTLKDLCFDTWAKWFQEEQKNKDFNDAVRKEEAALKAYMDKKKGEAKNVLSKMTSGTDTGLQSQVFTAWAQVYQDEKKGKELEEILQSQKSKFKTLNSRQKSAGYNTVTKANALEEENIIMHIFMNWVMYIKIELVIKVFGGRMDKKRGQLEQVQSMFKSFATQLEQGIGTTPRRSQAAQAAAQAQQQGSATRQALQQAA
jgi:hypothetical protein